MASATPDVEAIQPGSVIWVSLDPTRGREQRGHRPALVVSGHGFLEAITTLVTVVPLTTSDRGWPNHIALTGPTGLAEPSWVMTEQLRTLSRERITRVSGTVDARCLREVRRWLADFLDFPFEF